MLLPFTPCQPSENNPVHWDLWMDYMQPQMAKLSTAVKCIKPQHNAEQIELERKEKKKKIRKKYQDGPFYILCT